MLYYNVKNEWLHGSIGPHHFSMHAYSGGGRGSVKRDVPEHASESWNVFRAEDRDHKVRGGPIPPGMYICEYHKHERFGECIRLRSLISALPPRQLHLHPVLRGGFYIHGRGDLGSDGCIVPHDRSRRLNLNAAIKEFPGTRLQVEGAW
jgi:hypothetical protein